MSVKWSREESVLLDLLRVVTGKENRTNPDADCDWEQLLKLAESHAVTAMLYDTVESLGLQITERIKKTAQTTVLANYRLLFLTSYLTKYLEAYGIVAVTLKGAATAALYPVPEYRKSGDVDLLIPVTADYERALVLLQQAGFWVDKEQLALHHTDLRNTEGISVELHNTLTEPFENKNINHYLIKILPEYAKHTVENTDWGVRLVQPSDAYHAFYLVVHMLQHFLREGFGLKNLCDWTLFWNREVAAVEKERFQKLTQRSGTGQFVRILTAACVRELGLSPDKVSFLLTEPVRDETVTAFMQEVLQAGEFGRAETDRMVAMRRTGFMAYAKEFHHQMHLNFPGIGRVFVIWPLLWALTLMRFLHNNRRLGRASVYNIVKKAAKRSELIEQMRLFR